MNKKIIEEFFEIDPGDVPKIGIAYITDKQYIVYKTFAETRDINHFGLIDKIDEWVHPGDWIKGNRKFERVKRENNVYIDLYNNYVDAIFAYIHLPVNMELSYSEYLYIESFLDCVDAINSKISSKNRNIEVKVITINPRYLNEDNKKGIKHIKEKLRELVTKDISFSEERIVGSTLPRKDILESISFHVDIKGCKNLVDLYRAMNVCDKYYNDDYYRDLFLSVFPNYPEVGVLFNEIRKSCIGPIIFDNLTFANIYDTLSNIYNNYAVFSKKTK